MSYSERLKKLNLPLLVYRRARGDMIEIFKHFHSYDNFALPENCRPRNWHRRKHDYQVVWKAPKDGVRGLQANFFLLPNDQNWNELPKEIVHAKSIDSFKYKSDEAWEPLIASQHLAWFVTSPHKATSLRGHANLWVGAPLGMSPS